jgi:hypothetical protein
MVVPEIRVLQMAEMRTLCLTGGDADSAEYCTQERGAVVQQRTWTDGTQFFTLEFESHEAAFAAYEYLTHGCQVGWYLAENERASNEFWDKIDDRMLAGMDETYSEDGDESCGDCGGPLGPDDHILCNGCVCGRDDDYKERALARGKGCSSCGCKFKRGAGGGLGCACDDDR